jgi:hypothetical protein
MTMSEEERKLKLARVLAVEANHGWKVESQTDYTAVLFYGKGGKINHILHLLLSIFTLGIWLIVWIIIGLTSQRKTKVISITDNGDVIVDFGTVKKFTNSEKNRIQFPLFKKKSFWVVTALIVLLAIGLLGNSSSNNSNISTNGSMKNPLAYDYENAPTALPSIDSSSYDWIPGGFNQWSDNIAWRWAEKGEFKCKYGESCWGMFVVSKEGCPNSLYAEINLYDSTGTNIGYTNESLSSLAPYEKGKMVFDTFDE